MRKTTIRRAPTLPGNRKRSERSRPAYFSRLETDFGDVLVDWESVYGYPVYSRGGRVTPAGRAE